MAKKKRNKDDDLFRLEEEIRELKSLNRSLHRQIKKLNKGYNKLRNEDLEEQFEEEVLVRKEFCEACGKGILIELDLGPKVIKVCELCKWRGKARNK